VEFPVEEKMGHLRPYWAHPVVKRSVHKLQDEDGDPERQDNEDSCQDLCPKMFEDSFHRDSL
jgi:hypothetical protein